MPIGPDAPKAAIMQRLKEDAMDTCNDTRSEEIIDLGVATEETKGVGIDFLDSQGGKPSGIEFE